MPTSDRQNQITEQIAKLSVICESLESKLDLLRDGISERFQHTDAKISKLQMSMDEKIDNLESSLHNPDGLFVRVDRLEVAETKRDRTITMIATAVIGSIVAAIFAIWRS